ncbi:hypothetical protein Tco_0271683 [Tanacetum coccineum]
MRSLHILLMPEGLVPLKDTGVFTRVHLMHLIYEYILMVIFLCGSSEDDQADDKNDDDENAQDDKTHSYWLNLLVDDENVQDDDDEAQTESEDDGDDFIHPKLTTHDDETTHEEETDEDDTFDPIVHTPSRVSSSDDEDSDNEVEGMDAEGEKSDEDATYVEDQGNEAVKDTNANLEGRDDVMTDVILPQVQATQEIKDTHVTPNLPVNPDGQQQSSSVSSGFVSNMLNPNQDTGVDAIFGQHAEATSLIDIPVTAIAEPSFFAPTNQCQDIQRQLYKAIVDAHRVPKVRRSEQDMNLQCSKRKVNHGQRKDTTTCSRLKSNLLANWSKIEELCQSKMSLIAPASSGI